MNKQIKIRKMLTQIAREPNGNFKAKGHKQDIQ